MWMMRNALVDSLIFDSSSFLSIIEISLVCSRCQTVYTDARRGRGDSPVQVSVGVVHDVAQLNRADGVNAMTTLGM